MTLLTVFCRSRPFACSFSHPFISIRMRLSSSTYFKISTTWLSLPTPSPATCSLIHFSLLSQKSTVAFHGPNLGNLNSVRCLPPSLSSTGARARNRGICGGGVLYSSRARCASSTIGVVPHLDAGHGGFPVVDPWSTGLPMVDTWSTMQI